MAENSLSHIKTSVFSSSPMYLANNDSTIESINNIRTISQGQFY